MFDNAKVGNIIVIRELCARKMLPLNFFNPHTEKQYLIGRKQTL